MTQVSKEGLNYSKQVLDILDEVTVEVDGSTIFYEPINEIDKKLKAACLSFISSFTYINPNSEDSFMDHYLKPFIKDIIMNSCKDDFICSGNGALNSSTTSKKKSRFHVGFQE